MDAQQERRTASGESVGAAVPASASVAGGVGGHTVLRRADGSVRGEAMPMGNKRTNRYIS
jgi:hypothetical protein